ncbi:MAG: LysM peptidoglycan-binding domain-containing protein [Crocinitomicaceae bacterium]
MTSVFFLYICIINFFGVNAQEELDTLVHIDSTEVKKTIALPVFQRIDPDTIQLSKHDEMISDSYSAMGKSLVYDALHSFNRRRTDYFGGYMNVKVNAGLERIRKKGFQSDIKKLYIQIDPLSLSVYWIAVVGPSEDGKCYVCIDSRGSAGGGLSAVNGQIPSMHRWYPSMEPKLLLDFNEDVLQCYEWDGTLLPEYKNYINIRQKFYKYATDCYKESTNSVIVSLKFKNTGYDTMKDGQGTQNVEAKKVASAKSKVYKVKSGDTLGFIAQRYHTSVYVIKRLNQLKSDNIKVGQVLKIPL